MGVDAAFETLVRVLASALQRHLASRLTAAVSAADKNLIVANQYVLADAIRRYIIRASPVREDGDDLVHKLATARIFRLANSTEQVSLLDIHVRRTPQWPVWYAPRASHLNWAGGAFKRDFIALPPACPSGAKVADFFEGIFETVFGDAVNLDRIGSRPGQIADLVKRGIVSREALVPDVKSVTEHVLSAAHRKFLAEVNSLLAHPAVKEAVTRNLCLPVSDLRATYFAMGRGQTDAEVATGLFDGDGNLLRDLDGAGDAQVVLIGLESGHPLIEHLVNATKPTRAHYALTYVAHRLTLAQQRLVPDTPEFYFVRNHLSHDMRRALVDTLVTSDETE